MFQIIIHHQHYSNCFLFFSFISCSISVSFDKNGCNWFLSIAVFIIHHIIIIITTINNIFIMGMIIWIHKANDNILLSYFSAKLVCDDAINTIIQLNIFLMLILIIFIITFNTFMNHQQRLYTIHIHIDCMYLMVISNE